MKHANRNVIRLAAALGLLLASQVLVAAEAKNVILMIADGGGFGAFTAGSYYEHGASGRQPYEQADWQKLAACTYPLNRAKTPTGAGQDPEVIYDPAKAWDTALEQASEAKGSRKLTRFRSYNYLLQTYTDSAAAASALATGVKTYNTSINFTDSPAATGTPLLGKTIAEIARQRGRAAGAISTVPISHATPAGLGGAHNFSRNNYAAIATEMLNADTLDVLMGAGHPEFDNNGNPNKPKAKDYDAVGGQVGWDQLKSGAHPGGWKLVQTPAEFAALAKGPTPKRVLGIPQVSSTLQQARKSSDWNQDGRVSDEDKRVAPVFGDPRNNNVPTLAVMARGALNVLKNTNKGGFYLMIEGGAVDWAGHANQPARLIEEQMDFNEAVAAVVDWVNANSNWNETLLIITADHETGMLWGPNSDEKPFDPIVCNGKGKMPGLRFNSREHTNSLVPLFARGAGAADFASHVVGRDPVRGPYVQNTTVFTVMNKAMGGSAAR